MINEHVEPFAKGSAMLGGLIGGPIGASVGMVLGVALGAYLLSKEMQHQRHMLNSNHHKQIGPKR